MSLHKNCSASEVYPRLSQPPFAPYKPMTVMLLGFKKSLCHFKGEVSFAVNCQHA